MNRDFNRHLALLLLAAGLVLLAGLGLRDAWPADEPRFALIAKQIVESGNWLLPQVGGIPYPDKPPLFFWLVAALYTLTGSLRVALLLPGVIAGLGVLALVSDLGRRLWNAQTGIWCGVTLLASVQFVYQMKMGQIDGLLCLWTTLGLYGLCRHLLLGPDWRWYGIAGLSAGLGIITKGVGFLPYLVFIPYLFAARFDWPVSRHSWRDRRWLLAPAATLAVVAAWLVPMLVATAGNAEWLAYRNDILFHQTLTRFAASWSHVKPFWYLFSNAIPWLWLPITLLLPWLVPAWWRDLRQKDARILLPGGWLLLVLLFFSLSSGKRSLYIFPALPALALITGYHASRLLSRAGVQRILVALPLIIGLISVAGAIYALMNPHQVEQWLINVPTIIRTSLALLAIGFVMSGTIALTRRRRVMAGYAIAMGIFWIGASLLVAPALNDIRSGKALIAAMQAKLEPATEIGFVAWPEQFLLHWQGKETHFGYRRDPKQELPDALSWLTAAPGRMILLPDTLQDPCLDPALLTTVGRAHRRNWLLADLSALRPHCRQALAPIVISDAKRDGQRRSADSGS